MKRSNLVFFGIAGLVTALAAQMACSPIGRRGDEQCDGVFENGECTPDNSGGAGGTGQTGSSTGEGGDIFITTGSAMNGSTGSGSPNCGTDPNVDDDKDGATENQGDCNDCDANVGPGAIEVLTDPNDPMAQKSDEDCDGQVDNVATYCDQNLALEDVDPNNAVRAVDICKFVDPGKLSWGVLSAMYVKSNGAPISPPATPGTQVGLLSDFGPNVAVQGGSRMLALATGSARLPNQGDACGISSCGPGVEGTPPTGFPQDPPTCPISTDIWDDVGLEVRLRAPTNATGYKFSFKFYSFEYPEWVCQSYNDQFISLVKPAPVGSINGNISFDSKTNPVSVNVAFFDVCQGCPAGTGQMQGTGFNDWNDAGATSWLQSQAPVTGGQEFIIRWAIWDTGDSAYDSTALVDNFEWIANGGTVVVGTTPIPDPK